MGFIQDIKRKYEIGTIVQKLIYINVGLYILTLLFYVFGNLYNSPSNFLYNWFSLESDYGLLLLKPWTIISFGFLHGGFFHILFNMICLHFVGNLFIQYFTQKQLLNF